MVSQAIFCYSNRDSTFTPASPGRRKTCQQCESERLAGCLGELSSSSPHRKQIHRHITGKHIHATLTKHTVKRHAHAASGLYLRPGRLQSVLKSLPGVHSQPWTQEEGWEGETSKVNTRLIWASSIYICYLVGGRKKMKQAAKQEDVPAAIDLYVCINLNLTESDL